MSRENRVIVGGSGGGGAGGGVFMGVVRLSRGCRRGRGGLAAVGVV